MSFQVPILFITFNRLDTTRQVFEAIRKVQPETLYLFSDAGREGKLEEQQQVIEVRKWLLEQINWPCKINTLFLDQNMGPRYAIGHAINWLFKQEEAGVIFEHDCLPHITFFRFCEELLDKYKNDETVMHISGNNFLFNEVPFEASYTFTRHNHIWGFATWKRAWQKYDPEMSGFDEYYKNGCFNELIPNKRIRKEYLSILNGVKEGSVDTWDYQWFFNTWYNNGLGVIPAKNLVSNIGYGDLALNTNKADHILANIATHEIGEIKHPSTGVKVNKEAERVYLKYVFPPLLYRIRVVNKLLRQFGLNV
jgi:hypothetical protein